MKTGQQVIDEGYAEGKKSFEYLWQQIEENFNWERVYKVMKLLDWHWHIHNQNYGIPIIDTIKKEARRLCFDVYDQSEGVLSTGGFSASYKDNMLFLSFILEEWDAD